MPKAKLNDRERIAIAAVVTLGKSAIDDAYRIVNTRTDSDDFTIHRMALRWWRGDMVQQYFNELQALHAHTMSVSQKDDPHPEEPPLTREMLIHEMRKSMKQVNDPESRSKLVMRLADLADLKKPEEQEKADQRRFFIAFKSDCRRCRLMDMFLSLNPKEDSI